MFSQIGHKAANAKLINAAKAPYLLATFKESTSPVVWYYDLRKAKNAIITLRNNEGDWEVGTTQGDGAFTAIATFEDKIDAELAMDTIQRAVLRRQFFPKLGAWTRLLLVIILVLVGTMIWATPSADDMAALQVKLGTTKEQINTNKDRKQIKPGVPMNADDVLVPPKD